MGTCKFWKSRILTDGMIILAIHFKGISRPLSMPCSCQADLDAAGFDASFTYGNLVVIRRCFLLAMQSPKPLFSKRKRGAPPTSGRYAAVRQAPAGA
jgi:hypothetical protein